MNVADYILDFLVKKKVKHVFLITGGAISFVVDAFSRNKKISYTCVAHEQAAAMMADSYSRMGPNFSATMVTSGPGATNLLTGIACSWFDSIPSIHICGQVNSYELCKAHKSTKNVRQVGFQETDIVTMAKPITKLSYQLKNAQEIKYVLEKAYHVAQSERPGPVLIDIPMNFQRTIINPNKLKSFRPVKKKNSEKIIINQIIKIKDFLNKSKRPVIIVGGGIRYSKTTKNLLSMAENLEIPIVSTWSGIDSISHDHKNYIGSIGVYGSRAANFVIQNSDFILCLGSRLDTRITGGVPKNFARDAVIAAVDIDKNELNKERGLKIDIKINTNLSLFFKLYNNVLKNFKLSKLDWVKQALELKQKYPMVLQKYREQKRYVNPYVFMEKLSKFLKNDDVIIADDGAHLTWAIQGLKITKKQRLFSAFGNSPMGYAFPASLGASIALNKKRIICIDGDGSIQMNIQEFHTMVSNKLPIKIFIMNNNGYGIIKQFQELYLGKRYEATGKGVSNPDFKKVCKGFGVNYLEVKRNKDIEGTIKKALNSKKSQFVNLFIHPNQKIIPKLSFGDPIEDLSPKIPRYDFYRNMIAKPIYKNNKIIEAN